LEKDFRIYNRLVGQGGMAKVFPSPIFVLTKIFLGQNRVSRQYVACKIVRLDTTKPKSVVHAKNEIDILSNLSHVPPYQTYTKLSQTLSPCFLPSKHPRQ
jgi:hypothetical protein